MTGVQIIVPRNLLRSLPPAPRPSGSVSRQDESRPDPSSPSSSSSSTFLFLPRRSDRSAAGIFASSGRFAASRRFCNAVVIYRACRGPARLKSSALRFLERPRAFVIPFRTVSFRQGNLLEPSEQAIRSVFQEDPLFSNSY